MEMEHINENTIRVLIGNEDLADRGITFLDLLGNHKEVESFFYSILEEVDIEDEFQGSEAVTFQVLPKSDGLELFISKNVSSEDLSTYDSFNNMKSGEGNNFINEQIEDEFTNETIKNVVFELDDFEALVELANEVRLPSTMTNFYSFQENYYLQIVFLLDELGANKMEDSIAQVLEFANLSSVTSGVLSEHGTCIMERNALDIVRYYFD